MYIDPSDPECSCHGKSQVQRLKVAKFSVVNLFVLFQPPAPKRPLSVAVLVP